MEYWVDGYNLILRKRWVQTMTLEAAREKLLRAVVALNSTVNVFFDASRNSGGSSGLTGLGPSSKVIVTFVRSGSADDSIIERLKVRGHQEVSVVTDDRELRGRVKQLGGNTVGVDRFLEKLDRIHGAPVSHAKPRTAKKRSADKDRDGRPQHLSKGEVDEWMNAFGLDEIVDLTNLDQLDDELRP